MIDPSSDPIDHRNPYKRVDLAARRHPSVITQRDYDNGMIPDESIYAYDWNDSCWHLKDGK